ncbi:MAG: lysophospholipase [Holophagales bacterium]|nr:lysophospholipase [Holophagales bacterium]
MPSTPHLPPGIEPPEPKDAAATAKIRAALPKAGESRESVEAPDAVEELDTAGAPESAVAATEPSERGDFWAALASRPTQQILRYTLPSLAVAGGLGALELARSRFQHRHMFAPTRHPEGDWDPAAQGLGAEDVWLESEDGTRLHGWWMPLPSAGRSPAREPMTVVYCHGNSGNMSGRIDVFQGLHRLGVHVFAFDYRGYGRSDGSPSEAGVCADVRAALDHVVEVLGVPWHRILLFGHSLGGAVAIHGALHRPDIAGLVVQSSFTQVTDMARHFFPDIPVHWITRNGFRSEETVARLEMPKLFIHGGADPTVPFEHGERLFAAAAEPKIWLPVARAGHNDVHLWGGLRYLTYLLRFRRHAERHGLERAAAEG